MYFYELFILRTEYINLLEESKNFVQLHKYQFYYIV